MAKKPKDPNRYAHHEGINPNSLTATLLSVLNIGLMLLGIAGVAYHTFSPNGLGSRLLDKAFSSLFSLIIVAIVAIALYALNRYLSGNQNEGATKRGNFLMYIMIGLGAFFLFRLLTTGSF